MNNSTEMVVMDDAKIVKVLAGDSNFTKNWRTFCRALKFGQDIMFELERMNSCNCAIQDIIFNIMEHWKNVDPKNFNAKMLSEKLREMGCTRSAEIVESFCGCDEDIQRTSDLIWFKVRSPTRYYSGREKEIEIIEKECQECLQKKVKRFVAITGLGGMGKSDLAANYAKQFHESFQGHCIWIDAESKQTVMQSFQSLAENEFQIPLKDPLDSEIDLITLVQEIYRKLSDKKCLFIFDNLDSYEEPTIELILNLSLKQSPSILKPFVVTTSRFQPAVKYFGSKCTQLELDILKEEAAIQFFCNYLKLNENAIQDSTIKVIRRLCERLDCYPLAMQQAAAYLNENLQHNVEMNNSDVEQKIEEYLAKIDIQTALLLNHKIPEDSRTTYLTWRDTFEKISKIANDGTKATQLMNIISFLSPDSISIAFLMKIFQRMKIDAGYQSKIIRIPMFVPKFTVNFNCSTPMEAKAIKILQDHSIVKVQQKESLSVSRLVQEVNRIKMKEERELIGTLGALLQNVQKMMSTDEIESSQLIHAQKIWHHATENSELIKKWREFPLGIAVNLEAAGKYRELYEFICQALEALESTEGGNDRYTLVAKYWKGKALNYLGEYVKALDVLTQVFGKQKELFGEEDDFCLSTANQIANVHWKLGGYEEALKCHRKNLKIRERIILMEHPQTLSIKSNIARTLRTQGKYQEAKELLQQLLAVEERVQGLEHRETLATKLSLATVIYKQEKHEEALKMSEEVLQVREKVLEIDHPLTLTTKEWIAQMYNSLGRKEEAVQLQTEVLEKRGNILGPEHISTFDAKHSLAIVIHEQGEHEEALKMLEEVLECREKMLAMDHPDTLTTKYWIAEAYNSMRRNEAVQLHTEVWEKRVNILGLEHPDTIKSKTKLDSINKK